MNEQQLRKQLIEAQLAAVQQHHPIISCLREAEKCTNFSTAPVYIDETLINDSIQLLKRAIQYETAAQYELGHLYRGLDLMTLSACCFQCASDQGYLAATYWLGNLYYEGLGVKENIQRAFDCYEYAAKRGLADAMNNYADMHFRGETVPQNDEIAHHWFRKAAMLGVSEAMFTMGYMFEKGVGVEADADQSIYWFEQSAMHGDLYAANYLGHKAMQRGEFDEAFIWYLQAAEGQDVEGEYNVGFCYEEGVGVGQNLQKAKYWYQRAALQGDDQAKEKLSRF